ncbi:hypothetical protein [Coleofasciculus sp. E1-EBD-02]|uniref:hypothetical protein n=1 Tax=Coleofasciculus sp. E1-EBD-02 TaxID=3068481 RepID=UPI0032F54430
MGILSNESAEDIFMQLVNKCDISCNYSNIRNVLGYLHNKWQGSSPKKKKLWPLLCQKLCNYEVTEEDSDTLYILCQVARVLSSGSLQKTRSRLDAESSYAAGIMTILSNSPKSITPLSALEHLFRAYKRDKALDIQIALLIIYEELGYFNLRRSLLKQIVKRLAHNLNLFLKIPLPSSKFYNFFYDNKIQKNVPGLNLPLSKISENVENIINNYLYAGKVKKAEEKLKRIKHRVRPIQMPEVELNLAICCTLQGNWDGGLYHLEQVEPRLDNGQSSDISPIRQAYYQLAIYIDYKLGRFQQVQNLVSRAVQQDFQPWLQTLLGYMFFANSNYQLSQEVIQSNIKSNKKKHKRNKRNTHSQSQENHAIEVEEKLTRQILDNSLRENIFAQEYILLYLYWQDAVQSYPTKLNQIKYLRKLIFEGYGSEWTNADNTITRLFPDSHHLDGKIIAKNAQYYNVPDYVLAQYNQKSGAPFSVSAQWLAKLALHGAKFQDAKDILRTHWIENPKDKQAADWIIELYECFFLDTKNLDDLIKTNIKSIDIEIRSKIKARVEKLEDRIDKLQNSPPLVLDKSEFPTNSRVSQLIEKWMKSPDEHELVGEKFVTLLNQSRALRNLYWGRQDLRYQIWQALDLCLDYGCVEDILPDYLTLEALSDTVFHLLYVGRSQLVAQLIERTRGQFKQNNAENKFLKLLEQLSQEEISFTYHQKLYYLRLFFRFCSKYQLYQINSEGRKPGISALEIIAEYPDVNRQTSALLLLGKLQTLEHEYQAASESYRKVALELTNINDTSRLLAALCMMKLSMLCADISYSEELPTQGVSWQVKEKPLGQLLDPLAKLLGMSKSKDDRDNLAEVLSKLHLVIEVLQDKGEYEADSIQFILNALHQLPNNSAFALRLYEYLIGIEPLKGKYLPDNNHNNLEAVLDLFVDYELANQTSSELEQQIKSTLKTIGDQLDRNAKKSYLPEDRDIRDKWKNVQKRLEDRLSQRG